MSTAPPERPAQPRAVIYAAKSTQDKHGSIPTQLDDCRAMAKAEGWEIVKEFTDEGFSAYSGNRGPGLEQAKAKAVEIAAEHGKAYLIAQHSDRLARGAGDKPGAADSLVEIWHAMARQNVRLRSVQNDVMLSRALLVAASGELAHEESSRKSKSVAAGHARRRAKGEPHGGQRPYGYRYRDGELVQIDSEVRVVRRIFNEYLAGIPQLRIAANLQTDGVPTLRGGKWHQGTVRQMLANPIYAGMITDGEELRPGEHKAIIDPGTWEKVVALRKAKAKCTGKGGRPPKGRHLFRKGMLRCGICGESMVPRTDPNRKHDPYEVYRCYGRLQDPESCTMGPVPRKQIDAAVFSYFATVGLDVEATREQIQIVIDRRLADIRSMLTEAEAERQKARDRLARVSRDYQDGSLSADLYEPMAVDLKAERKAAEAQVEQYRASLKRIEREERDGLRDAEQETLQKLAELRAAVAGDINDADGIDAVRAALLRLFESFTLQPTPTEGEARTLLQVHLHDIDPTELAARIKAHGDKLAAGWIPGERENPEGLDALEGLGALDIEAPDMLIVPQVREDAIDADAPFLLRRLPLDQAADNLHNAFTR